MPCLESSRTRPAAAGGDIHEWLPTAPDTAAAPVRADRNYILLFYCYRELSDVEAVCEWQRELGRRLQLTGKIRVGSEGLNGSVAGSMESTNSYMDSVLQHPLFGSLMNRESFKRSVGNINKPVFPDGFQVTRREEIVSLGLPTDKVTSTDGGDHVTVDDFHEALKKHIEGHTDNTLFIDCRNFYEHKVGKFVGAVTPEIRKFNMWPAYVDVNKDMFRDKSVYMYCTGGIRCERASAYLKSKTDVDNVYQLSGGIHKYLEKYPDGLYRGKMFVFDDRFSIHTNDDVLSVCQYCGVEWDKYSKCSQESCPHYVLSCDECQKVAERTMCCHVCHGATETGAEQQCGRHDCPWSTTTIPKEQIAA